MLLIKDCFTSTEVKTNGDCKTLWAEVKLKTSRNSRLCSFYHPDHSPRHLEQFRLSLEDKTSVYGKNPNNLTFIGSDFNYPDFDWENYRVKPGSNRKAEHEGCIILLDYFP